MSVFINNVLSDIPSTYPSIAPSGNVGNIVSMEQSEYDALEVKDPDTLYIIVEA